ncbi:creatininase family protein [Herbiconiux ginsengi]|uniref:Creatinine amidohydrolase n=1 Tax=Herbiconiux ginsengi TaxID=381665 RepID=A0A1H3KFV2_9MICO|nr:creatininase family protein [Herbiconiux ginsengi]SDY51013.1 creatinine amidohydrolase [Herbiconiux ginsengi]
MIEAYSTPWTDVAAHFARSAAAAPGDRASAASGLALLPFGALEQHGPQLPLGTDTATAAEVARRLAMRLDAVLLPPVHYGDTWNNAGYPGTVSLSSATVTAIAVDIGRALVGSGARGLVIVNGDWGNRQPLYAAVRLLNDEGVLPAIALDYPGMDAAIDRVRESAAAAPGLNHAEEVETSLMLAIAPGTVRTDRYVSSYPAFPSDFGTRPMQLHPFSESGVFGDPSSATAAKGEDILTATVEASLAVLADFVASLPRP